MRNKKILYSVFVVLFTGNLYANPMCKDSFNAVDRDKFLTETARALLSLESSGYRLNRDSEAMKNLARALLRDPFVEKNYPYLKDSNGYPVEKMLSLLAQLSRKLGSAKLESFGSEAFQKKLFEAFLAVDSEFTTGLILDGERPVTEPMKRLSPERVADRIRNTTREEAQALGFLSTWEALQEKNSQLQEASPVAAVAESGVVSASSPASVYKVNGADPSLNALASSLSFPNTKLVNKLAVPSSGVFKYNYGASNSSHPNQLLDGVIKGEFPLRNAGDIVAFVIEMSHLYQLDVYSLDGNALMSSADVEAGAEKVAEAMADLIGVSDGYSKTLPILSSGLLNLKTLRSFLRWAILDESIARRIQGSNSFFEVTRVDKAAENFGFLEMREILRDSSTQLRYTVSLPPLNRGATSTQTAGTSANSSSAQGGGATSSTAGAAGSLNLFQGIITVSQTKSNDYPIIVTSSIPWISESTIVSYINAGNQAIPSSGLPVKSFRSQNFQHPNEIILSLLQGQLSVQTPAAFVDVIMELADLYLDNVYSLDGSAVTTRDFNAMIEELASVLSHMIVSSPVYINSGLGPKCTQDELRDFIVFLLDEAHTRHSGVTQMGLSRVAFTRQEILSFSQNPPFATSGVSDVVIQGFQGGVWP